MHSKEQHRKKHDARAEALDHLHHATVMHERGGEGHEGHKIDQMHQEMKESDQPLGVNQIPGNGRSVLMAIPKEMDNRAYNAGEGMKDSPASIQRAGAEDPRRYDAKILIDRKIQDHDMSGYNHNATSIQPANGGNENIMWAREQDVKAKGMGTPNPDGTYSK